MTEKCISIAQQIFDKTEDPSSLISVLEMQMEAEQAYGTQETALLATYERVIELYRS